MRKLGISIYPEKTSFVQIKSYIKSAAEAGFTRMFTCLLSVEESKKDQTIQKMIQSIKYAKEYNFEIIIDISPKIFNMLNISYDNLSFFKEINVDGIRLDYGYGGNKESLMTFNPENLDIEINMSNNTHYLDTIIDFQPNIYNLRGCHNFYPHNHSGLTLEHFQSCNHRFKKHGLKTACFVTSQNKNTFGPWPVTEGLPTLEMHRDLPLLIQIKHLISLNEIDDIIISNCYPSQSELDSIKNISLTMLSLDVELVSETPIIERNIAFDNIHYNRGDISENLVRSTESRVKYKEHSFEIFNCPSVIKRGDIIIESSLYGHYAGELQLALKDMKNTGKSNVIGRIVKDELFLLDTIKPWQKFILREAK